MIHLRMFLSVNNYTDISEQSFNQMGAYDAGLSPVHTTMPDYSRDMAT